MGWWFVCTDFFCLSVCQRLSVADSLLHLILTLNLFSAWWPTFLWKGRVICLILSFSFFTNELCYFFLLFTVGGDSYVVNGGRVGPLPEGRRSLNERCPAWLSSFFLSLLWKPSSSPSPERVRQIGSGRLMISISDHCGLPVSSVLLVVSPHWSMFREERETGWIWKIWIWICWQQTTTVPESAILVANCLPCRCRCRRVFQPTQTDRLYLVGCCCCCLCDDDFFFFFFFNSLMAANNGGQCVFTLTQLLLLSPLPIGNLI